MEIMMFVDGDETINNITEDRKLTQTEIQKYRL